MLLASCQPHEDQSSARGCFKAKCAIEIRGRETTLLPHWIRPCISQQAATIGFKQLLQRVQRELTQVVYVRRVDLCRAGLSMGGSIDFLGPGYPSPLVRSSLRCIELVYWFSEKATSVARLGQTRSACLSGCGAKGIRREACLRSGRTA